MNPVLTISAFVLAAGSAVRSTWSPCGLSMLSSITPFGERGRGQRFASTASGYLAGAIVGGATLGAAFAAAAAAVHVIGPGTGGVVVLAAGTALAGAAADSGLLGFRLPVLRRQVNELWLDRYRGWVYGAGFGWQVGVGFATYVMTAAVAVVAVLAALTGDVTVAFGVGATFGTVRGLTILANSTVTDPGRLRAAHRRYAAWRRPVWMALVAAQLVVGAGLGATVWLPSLALVPLAAAALLLIIRPARIVVLAGEAPI